jgi:hypothetical protein
MLCFPRSLGMVTSLFALSFEEQVYPFVFQIILTVANSEHEFVVVSVLLRA